MSQHRVASLQDDEDSSLVDNFTDNLAQLNLGTLNSYCCDNVNMSANTAMPWHSSRKHLENGDHQGFQKKKKKEKKKRKEEKKRKLANHTATCR